MVYSCMGEGVPGCGRGGLGGGEDYRRRRPVGGGLGGGLVEGWAERRTLIGGGLG